jgi:caa(3)-type oxidase subunit IV
MATDTSHVHVDRKEYWFIFMMLAVFTVLEVGVVEVPGISSALLIIALTLLAVVKAGLVGLFFMHLNHDTKVVRWSVIIAMGIPFFYALVLIADGMWRLAP